MEVQSRSTFVSFDPSKEPLNIPLETIQRILEYDYAADAIALFTVLYYKAKQNGDHKVRTNADKLKQSLRFGNARYMNAKAVLKELGLVEDYAVRSETSGRLLGHGISINLHVGTTVTVSHPVVKRTRGNPAPSPPSPPSQTPLPPAPPRGTQKVNQKVDGVSFESLFPNKWWKDQTMIDAWSKWLRYRRRLKLSQSEETIKANATKLKKLSQLKAERAVVVIDTAIEAGWKRLYPVDADEYTLAEKSEDPNKYSDAAATVVHLD